MTAGRAADRAYAFADQAATTRSGVVQSADPTRHCVTVRFSSSLNLIDPTQAVDDPNVLYLGPTPPAVGEVVAVVERGTFRVVLGYPAQGGTFYPIAGKRGGYLVGDTDRVPVFALGGLTFTGTIGPVSAAAFQAMVLDLPRALALPCSIWTSDALLRFTLPNSPDGSVALLGAGLGTDYLTQSSASPGFGGLAQVAYDPVGQRAYAAVQLFAGSVFQIIAVDTQAMTVLTTLTTADTISLYLVFDQHRNLLWGLDGSTGDWTSYDPATLTVVGTPFSVGSLGSPMDVSWDPTTGHLLELYYIANFSHFDGVNAVAVTDPATATVVGTLSWPSPYPNNAKVKSVVADPARRRAYLSGTVLGDGWLYAYDLDTYVNVGTCALPADPVGKLGLDPVSGAVGTLVEIGGLPSLCVVSGPAMAVLATVAVPGGITADVPFGVAPYGPGMDGVVY